MEIRKINNTNEFDNLTEVWRNLQVYSFGPLVDLNEAGEDSDIQVLVGEVEEEAVAYLIADGRSIWNIEIKANHIGNGYAKQLAKAARINYAYEVCSDSGAALCESLGIEWEDCRE